MKINLVQIESDYGDTKAWMIMGQTRAPLCVSVSSWSKEQCKKATLNEWL
jgi:hypothetical protein